MTDRQVKYDNGRKAQIMRQLIEDECGREIEVRRATLPSSDDTKRMAIESSRAKLIRQLVTRDDEYDTPNEFGSSYRGPSRYVVPPYSLTSHHTDRTPISKKSPSMFPSYLDKIRYCARVDVPTPEVSQTNLAKGRKFKCKCENCVQPHCPAKVLSRKKPAFKDNIMTFCDRSTMTVKVANANCGCTPSSSRVECGVSTSMVAVRDTDGTSLTQIVEMGVPRPPTPILKKCSFACGHRRICNGFQDKVLLDSEMETDMALGQEVKQSASLKCFFRLNKCKSIECQYEEVNSRMRNIYNEGISDVIASQLPASPVGKLKIPLLAQPLPECCGAILSRCCDADGYMPHSHRYDSKYHSNCKKSKENICGFEKDCSGVPCTLAGPCPRLVKNFCHRRPKPVFRNPNIRLPKKVLTSEREIEDFIETNQCHGKCRKR